MHFSINASFTNSRFLFYFWKPDHHILLFGAVARCYLDGRISDANFSSDNITIGNALVELIGTISIVLLFF